VIKIEERMTMRWYEQFEEESESWAKVEMHLY
jgi:hypothetical protein